MEAVHTPAEQSAGPGLSHGGHALEQRLTRVLESMSLAFCSLDREWRYTYVNARAEQVLGMRREDLLGGLFWDLFPSAVGTAFETHYREAMDGRRAVTFRAHYPAPLDAWYELTADGSDEGLAVYFTDITDRVSTQEAAARSSQRVLDLGRVALALSDADDITALATTMAEQGLRALGADGGAVAVPAPDDPGQLWSYITASYGEGVQTDYGRMSVETPLPVCEAYTSGQRLLYPDAGASCGYSPAMAEAVAATGCQAWASVPLRAGGDVIGVLTAGWQAPQPFDAEQLDLLETLASQCSQALVRISARDAERASSAQQAALVAVARALGEAESEDDVLAVVAVPGAALLDANGSALCLQEPSGTHMRVLTTDTYSAQVRTQLQRLPADFPLPAVATARTGTAFFHTDRDQTLAEHPGAEALYTAGDVQASAAAPLYAHGRLLGCLSLSFARPRAWSRADVQLVEAFATLTAQALERIASWDAEQASTIQQATLVALAAALGQTQSEADVFAVVTQQSIGLLGAFGSGLCLHEPGGARVRTLATGTIPTSVRDPLQRLPADYPLPLVDTAISGTSHFLVDRAEAAARFSAAEEHYTAGGVQASAQVPLQAQGVLFGSLSLAFSEARPWPPADRAVVQAFAALVSQALERIYAREAELAASAEVARFSETLQRSLLTSPPEPDHLHIAVRYSPAVEQAQVGGDWYDAFITADGSTSLVIGDVTGHDKTAAAAMGQLRNLLRGIAYAVGDPPAAILRVLDRAAHDLAVDTTATLVLARLEQSPEQHRTGERLLRWSNAGHPPPLLITPDGSARYLEAPSDLLLGINADIARHDHEVVLAPGSTVLLYTDGLVERRGAPLQDGLDWLLGAVTAVVDLPVDELCDALLEQVGGQLDDDVALLALRAYREDEPRPAEAGPGCDPHEEQVLSSGSGA